MYKCNDCGLIFEEPSNYSEDRTPGGVSEGGSFIEHYVGCPRCGGSFDEAEECEECGKYYNIYELEDGICDKCYEGKYENE